MSRSSAVPERVVVGLSHGADDPERVAVAYVMGIEALRAGRQALMWLTGEAVTLGVEGMAGTLHLAGGPSIEELHHEYVGRGGLFYACPTSVHLRGLAGATWIRHAEVKGSRELYGYLERGAIVLHS